MFQFVLPILIARFVFLICIVLCNSDLYFPVCIICFGFSEFDLPNCMYVPMLIYLFIFELNCPMCNSRFAIFDVYFSNYMFLFICPRIVIVRFVCSDSYCSSYVFRCLLCVERFRILTPLHVLQCFYSFSSKISCGFYTSKKLHAFVRACDVCTFNVHFYDNFRNRFESKINRV